MILKNVFSTFQETVWSHLNRRLNVGRTSQWYILMALRILQYAAKTKVARVNA